MTKIYLKWCALVEHNLCSTKKTCRTICADKIIINDFGSRAQVAFYQELYVEQYVVTDAEGGRTQVVLYQETYVEQYVATYGKVGRTQVVFYQKPYVEQYVATYGVVDRTVGIHQVPFPMCTFQTLQKYCSTGSLLLLSVNFTLSILKVSFPQTMSISCIFVFAPSFIRMDLSIVTSSTSLTFPEFLVLSSSTSLLVSFIESHFALSSARWHL